MSTGLVAYMGWWCAGCACTDPGDIIIPGGLFCGDAPCMLGGGGAYMGIAPAGGYGMSWCPYGEPIWRIIPTWGGGPFGGGIGIHIGDPYCGGVGPLTTMGRGTGLGVIA